MSIIIIPQPHPPLILYSISGFFGGGCFKIISGAFGLFDPSFLVCVCITPSLSVCI